jgi:hypothetical protein
MVGTGYLDASATQPAVVTWHTVTQSTARWLSIAHNTVKQLRRLARILTT